MNIVNEKELLSRLDHPFIIKLFDTFRDRDRVYMLMEVVQVRRSCGGGGCARPGEEGARLGARVRRPRAFRMRR